MKKSAKKYYEGDEVLLFGKWNFLCWFKFAYWKKSCEHLDWVRL